MIGAILLIPVMYGLMAAYPFLESWVTGDNREHHLLDRPRNNPTRTGLGMAALTAYGVLMFAAGNDLMAIKLGMSINDITHILRAAFFIAPPLVFWVTKRICLSLQRKDRDLVLHGRETGRIVRTADGKFFEQHEPLDEFTRWNLVQHDPHEVLTTRGGDRRARGGLPHRAQGQGPAGAVPVLLHRPRSTRSRRPSWRPPTTTATATRRSSAIEAASTRAARPSRALAGSPPSAPDARTPTTPVCRPLTRAGGIRRSGAAGGTARASARG